MYKLFIKPIFFLFSPETIHHFSFRMLRFFLAIPSVSAIIKSIYVVEDKRLERELLGLKFPNPVGLAAGFDKDAKLFDELSCFGFGFIEIGTVTPKAQPGNEKQRIFRLVKEEALINRMGFNNEGIEKMIERLKKKKSKIIIGGNIGKNKDTPIENATDDYKKCFEALFDFVDYFVINVSSPNTPNLRTLQEKKPLTQLLNQIQNLNLAKKKPKPVLLKIAPDLTNEQLDDIIFIVNETKISGVIATNTTISRATLKFKDFTFQKGETFTISGGLSGKPLANRSTEVIKYLSEKSNRSFPIIGVGGIHSAEDAIEKLNAGADLVQIYTGFIYEGPSLVKKTNQRIIAKLLR